MLISVTVVKYTSTVHTYISNTSNMVYKLGSITVPPSTVTTMFSNELLSASGTKSVRNIIKLQKLDQMVVKLEEKIARLNNMVESSAVVSNLQSTKVTKTKKCQPDTGDRPDLIQTESVPSIGLARQTNYLSHISTDDLIDSLPVANRLPISRTLLSKELNSPVSLPVANKGMEDRHPDDKWVKDVLIKTTKCQPAARDTLSSGHTLHTVEVPVSCHTLPGHTLHTVVVPVSTGHTVHTLVPRVTVQVPVRPGHTVHTLVPRVTVQVPVGSHNPSGHTLYTPRVTVVVPVSSLNHTPPACPPPPPPPPPLSSFSSSSSSPPCEGP